MQLDRTQIAIRERSLLNILDLALRLVSVSWKPLTLAALPPIVMLMIANEALIGWMLVDVDDPSQVMRYLWTQTLLITIQAPTASVFMTTYLGQAVFQEQPKASAVLRATIRAAWLLLTSQLLWRGVGLSWCLASLIPRHGEYSGYEVWLLVLCVYAMIVRAARPFINEIILLERNPLAARRTQALTIRRRSLALHGPYTGELVARWLATSGIGMLLVFAIVSTIWFMQGTLFFAWSLGPWALRLIIPGTMWTVAAFLQVVRFLNYLDTRIRREGWEVELIVRAAAARLEGQLA